MNPLASYLGFSAVTGGALIAICVGWVCYVQIMPARPKGNRHHD